MSEIVCDDDSAENYPDLADPLSEDDELDSDEEEEYRRQIRESDGFDVEWFPRPGCGIFPYKIRDNYTPFNLALHSRLGLHCYNLQKGTNLKLIGVQKFNHGMGTPVTYYITMDAADADNNNARCTFQTCTEEHPFKKTNTRLESFVPLKIKKVIMQTRESGEEPPSLKLKASNAIFFMSFKCNGDRPSGKRLDYQAMVRTTMDGKPGHIRLEVDCWAGTP
ncbi:unnamed protein product [Microthlaspi erraticum]|uniref:Uncharacterized protein n=1 Tax=Microthlaspi erraticum TaxID=1685480 RepID=A0A6D2KE78_9BRAS|nr:unnamed protein product [Microthlaspi erraticum]